jgi:glycosyltransferase involved in cell wall biosynthesis
MFKKISIVTPTFNQGEFIEQTILSVINQTYENWEYIIIDGGSTDNTIDIIRKYEKHLKYWISESDGGQANAINKGLLHCDGEIFNWLNSDDFLEKGSLKIINEKFKDNIDVLAGGVNVFSSSSSQISLNSNLSAINLLTWNKGTNFIQPGVWLKLKNLVKAGGIDNNFHYSFDWDLYIRYLYLFSNVLEIKDVIVNFRLHELSKTESSQIKFEEERMEIAKKLSGLVEFNKIHSACIRKIEHHEYLSNLDSILSERKNNVEKIFNIIQLMKKTKDFRLLRISLGAIKRILK